jgi:hypothetical protein
LLEQQPEQRDQRDAAAVMSAERHCVPFTPWNSGKTGFSGANFSLLNSRRSYSDPLDPDQRFGAPRRRYVLPRLLAAP